MIGIEDRANHPTGPGVYVMHFPNGKKYIGMSRVCVAGRLAHHLNAAKAGRTKMVVRAAIAKHGPAMVAITFPECCKDPADLERDLVAQAKRDGAILYNMTKGGDGITGFRHAPAVREAMSVSARKSWTPDRREKASEKLRSTEVRGRLVASQKLSWTAARRANMAAMLRSRSAKLTEASVLKIANLITEGRSCASIGREFGVTPEAISAIKFGKNWAHVTGIVRSA